MERRTAVGQLHTFFLFVETVFFFCVKKVKSGETRSSGANAYLRFHAHSSAGYDTDNVRKTNQDSYISIGA